MIQRYVKVNIGQHPKADWRIWDKLKKVFLKNHTFETKSEIACFLRKFNKGQAIFQNQIKINSWA